MSDAGDVTGAPARPVTAMRPQATVAMTGSAAALGRAVAQRFERHERDNGAQERQVELDGPYPRLEEEQGLRSSSLPAVDWLLGDRGPAPRSEGGGMINRHA